MRVDYTLRIGNMACEATGVEANPLNVRQAITEALQTSDFDLAHVGLTPARLHPGGFTAVCVTFAVEMGAPTDNVRPHLMGELIIRNGE